MTAESITSTDQNGPACFPGEGGTAGPHKAAPAVRRSVTTPSSPPHLGLTAAAVHQLGVALTWVRRGHPVVPCSRRDKSALRGGFRRDATPDELAPFYDVAEIERWWAGRFERAHVGLLTRHLVVIDCDMPKAGDAPLSGRWEGCTDGTEVLARVLADVGEQWPETYTVLTPSGGVHLYFEQPEGDPIGCATGEGPTAPHLGPLVDVRGVGGYVIAAGSYSSEQGRPYERITRPGLRPQPLPAGLLARMRPATPAPPPAPVPVQRPKSSTRYSTRAERYAELALTGAADDVRAAPKKRGNAILYARARRLAELAPTAPNVITYSAVESHLVPAALSRGGDWTEREARTTVESGWRRGLQGAAA